MKHSNDTSGFSSDSLAQDRLPSISGISVFRRPFPGGVVLAFVTGDRFVFLADGLRPTMDLTMPVSARVAGDCRKEFFPGTRRRRIPSLTIFWSTWSLRWSNLTDWISPGKEQFLNNLTGDSLTLLAVFSVVVEGMVFLKLPISEVSMVLLMNNVLCSSLK